MRQYPTLGGWPGRVSLPQIPAGLSERGLEAGGMGSEPGQCLDIRPSGQASPLGISSWQLAYAPSQLYFYPSSCHLTQLILTSRRRQDWRLQPLQTLQGWTSPPSSASWTQLSEGSPFSRPRAAQVKCLGSDQETVLLLCRWPPLSHGELLQGQAPKGQGCFMEWHCIVEVVGASRDLPES